MKLKTWMELNNVSGYQMAKMLGVSRSAITHWMSGRCHPRGSIMIKISKFTDGAVNFDDFWGDHPAKKDK